MIGYGFGMTAATNEGGGTPMREDGGFWVHCKVCGSWMRRHSTETDPVVCSIPCMFVYVSELKAA